MRRAILLFSLICISLSIPAVSAPPDAPTRVVATSSGALAGRPTVYVLVEALNLIAIEAGQTVGDLKTDVELVLRSAGVPVADPDGLTPAKRINAATVYLNVNTAKAAEYPVCGISVDLEVHEQVKLVRAPQTEIFGATTWNEGITIVAGDMRLSEGVRDAVTRLAQKLANDYLTANPKQ